MIIQPTKLPFLEYLGWQIVDPYRLTETEMLSSYERGWRFLSQVDISDEELAWIEQLALSNRSWLISEFLDFRIDYHQIIQGILGELNHELLSDCRAYFGGGTVILMDLGEYRTSSDIDFTCPYGDGYRKLRRAIGEDTPQILLKNNSGLEISRFMIDQYGIKMGITLDGVTIKTEISAMAEFELDLPRSPHWSPVECLSVSDCFTNKLLANAYYFNNQRIQSRDLIDLAHLRLASPIPATAIVKAEAAYYRAMPALSEALIQFQGNSDLRFSAYEAWNIQVSNRPKLIDGIDLLAGDLGLDKTDRLALEKSLL